MVDRAGFDPAAFRFCGLFDLANRTFFGPSSLWHTSLNYRPSGIITAFRQEITVAGLVLVAVMGWLKVSCVVATRP